MNKKIYELYVVSKMSGRHVCMFYVKADSLYEAVVYASDYLVADALDIASVYTSEVNEAEAKNKHYEIYEAGPGRNYNEFEF